MTLRQSSLSASRTHAAAAPSSVTTSPQAAHRKTADAKWPGYRPGLGTA